jgi:phosphohistidine phosphatase SixA
LHQNKSVIKSFFKSSPSLVNFIIKTIDNNKIFTVKEIKELIWNTDSDKDLLIIGHNEGISEIATYFLGEDIHLKTATFIQISFEAKSRQEWSAGLGKIQIVFRPHI